MIIQDILAQIISLIGALVIVVNIITEVFKKVLEVKNEKITNAFVFATSEFLTIVSLVAYWKINDLPISYFTGIAFVVIGLMVSYAAMFGFDKLLKHLEGLIKK